MKRVFLVVLFLLSLSLCHAQRGEWVPGIVHVHTTFSDGSDNIPQRVARAKAEGCRFIIITDHYEQIEQQEKHGKWAGHDYGFADYFRNCREQTSDGFLCIPGAEIDSTWKPENEPTQESAHAHLLALRLKETDHRDPATGTYSENALIKALQCRENTQKQLIDLVASFGWIPVAAHPNLISKLSLQWPPWRWQDCRFDFRDLSILQRLQGIEMFNVAESKQQEDLFANYLGWLQQKKGNLFVTAGCDSHGWADAPELLQKASPNLVGDISLELLRQYLKVKDDLAWSRKTWVYLAPDQFTPEGLIHAIETGRTCATQYGARVTSLSPVPGEKTTMDRAVIKVRVEFPIPTTSQKEFVMYRDGNPVKSPPQNQPAGKTSYDYEWTDTDGSQGEHSYVLRVGEVLVTSPMWVGVTDEPLLSVEKAYVSKVSCSCMEAGLHGDIMIVLADGSQRKITANGLNSQPRISADGMTVGYLAGSHGKFWGDEHYIPDKICFFQSKGLPCLEAKYMIWDWQFRQDGKLVAIAVGAAKRGIQYYQLLDVQSGEVVDQCESDYFDAARGAKKPDWVTGLAKFE